MEGGINLKITSHTNYNQRAVVTYRIGKKQFELLLIPCNRIHKRELEILMKQEKAEKGTKGIHAMIQK